MKEEYAWQTKYVWYIVTDEGHLVHPGHERGSWCSDALCNLYDNEDEAVLGLQKFYGGRYANYDNHILQKVYVKLWGG